MGSSAATRNAHLSNYAAGIAQDTKSAIAEYLAPSVATGLASGQYKKYSDKNAFQVYDTLRALGGPNKRIQFAATDPFYNCQPRGLEIGIDDHERSKAGESGERQLEESKVKVLVTTAAISNEDVVVAAALAGLSAAAGVGEWSNAAKDPVAEIDALIEAIATDSGRMPNRILFGLGAWRVFRNHPKVTARQPGAEVIGVTGEQAAKMMLNPGIEIRWSILSKDTKKFGAAASKVNIVGGEVLIFYGQDNPTQYDPSFMKTFMPRVNAVDSVFQYRDEGANSDMYKTNWEDDVQVISTLMGRRITLS